MAQYYSLDEAARALGMSTDEFRRRLATEWKTSPRRYPDGATLRFQVREIDELARTLGAGSDTELKLSDSSEDFVPVQDDVLSSGPKSGNRGGKPDSDVKLEKGGKPKSGVQANIRTEEMDVPGKPSTTRKYQSPLEVSGEAGGKPPTKKEQSSSEFELSLTPDSSDEFDLKLTEDGSDEVDVGVMPGKSAARSRATAASICARPADSGISLEKSSSEFELQLDSGVSKPKSGPKSGPQVRAEIRPEDRAKVGPEDAFEASPGAERRVRQRVRVDAGRQPAAHPADATAAFPEEQKDIFETDFELPALDDESGSEAVAIEESDTDLESSDFDLGDGRRERQRGASVPESGKRRRAAAAEADLDEFDDDLVAEEDVAGRSRRPPRKPGASCRRSC